MVGIEKAGHLPNASTFCGRCEEVCPVRIPLPKLMRHWREREFERHLSPATVRTGLAVWGFLATRPRLYAVAMSLAVFALGLLGKIVRPLPLAAARRRLDAVSRFPGAGGADLPGAVEAAGANAMSALVPCTPPSCARACPGHPRLSCAQAKQDVDARVKPAHDEGRGR